jgi:hypothetical protein
MMSRFAQARQGTEGSRLPKIVRPAFLIGAAAVAYSQYFYPRPTLKCGVDAAISLRPTLVRAPATVTPIRRAAEADERVAVMAMRGQEGPEAEARLTSGLKLLIEIGRRQERR